MKRFRFRLEAALRLRAFTERQAEITLMEGEAALRHARDSRAGLEKEQRQHIADCVILRGAPILEPGMLIALERWTNLLDENAASLDEKIVTALLQRDVMKARLMVCRRDHEALDTLRTQQKAEHDRLAAVAEQAALDESAVLRWGRAA